MLFKGNKSNVYGTAKIEKVNNKNLTYLTLLIRKLLKTTLN